MIMHVLYAIRFGIIYSLSLIHAHEIEAVCRDIMENAKEIGMNVNPAKTQRVFTTTAIIYEIRAYSIELDGNRITSGEKLKTVGYTFGRRPGATDHIKRYRAIQIWRANRVVNPMKNKRT